MRPARPLQLNLAPGLADDPLVLEENFRRIEDFLGPYGGGAPHLELLARILGGQHFEGTVGQSTGVLTTDDTAFAHNLGRVPTIIILSTDTDASAGRVVGLPAGVQGPIGANVSPWTRTEIAVRATVTGAYQFIVL